MINLLTDLFPNTLSEKLAAILQRYHSMRLYYRVCIYLVILALIFWLIWSLPLTAHVTSFGYLDKELSNLMFLSFINDMESNGLFGFFARFNKTPDISLKKRLGFGDLFVNLYFLSLYSLKCLLFIIPSIILFPVLGIVMFFVGVFTANWIFVIVGLFSPLLSIIISIMFIIDLFMFYFGFLFQLATPLYILPWIILGLITGPLSGLIAGLIDAFSPAPVIGRVFTSGVSGGEKWVIRGGE